VGGKNYKGGISPPASLLSTPVLMHFIVIIIYINTNNIFCFGADCFHSTIQQFLMVGGAKYFLPTGVYKCVLLIGFPKNGTAIDHLFLFFKKYRLRPCGQGDRGLRQCERG